MQNRFKVLLLVFCFGVFCLLIMNTPIKKRNQLIYQAKHKLVVNIQKSKSEKQTKTEQFELTSESRSNLVNEFKTRRNRIQYLCRSLGNENKSRLKKVIAKMVVDTQHSLTWCPIYKSASSMWMKNFAVLSGFSVTESLHLVHNNHLDFRAIVRQKFQHNEDYQEKLEQISITTKFMVVRHPFERLLSAYRDKLENMQGREYYYRHYGKYITHKYRTKQSNLTSLEPSFTEFLQFIAKEKRFDEHWAPIFNSCQPCSIDYDYILKFESLSSEYNYFIEKNNLLYYLNHSKNNRKNTKSHGITNALVAEKYFQKVPAALLLSIFKIYELDFLLFSYSPAKYYYMTSDANREIYNFILNK